MSHNCNRNTLHSKNNESTTDNEIELGKMISVLERNDLFKLQRRDPTSTICNGSNHSCATHMESVQSITTTNCDNNTHYEPKDVATFIRHTDRKTPTAAPTTATTLLTCKFNDKTSPTWCSEVTTSAIPRATSARLSTTSSISSATHRRRMFEDFAGEGCGSGSMNSRRLVTKDGIVDIKYINSPGIKTRFIKDLFHTLMDAKWR